MKKMFLTAAVAVLMSTGVALAGGSSFGLGGAGGLTGNWSSAGNFAATQQFGNSLAGAATQSYGQSEATFSGGYTSGNGNGHGSPKSGFGGEVNSASGSQSIAQTAASGNGFSRAVTSGFGSAGGFSVGGAGVVKFGH